MSEIPLTLDNQIVTKQPKIHKKKLTCSQCGFISQKSSGVCWTHRLCSDCFKRSPIELERRRTSRRNQPKKKLICSQCGFTSFFSKSKRRCWTYRLCWKCFRQSSMGLERNRRTITKYRQNHPKECKKKLTCSDCGRKHTYSKQKLELKSL